MVTSKKRPSNATRSAKTTGKAGASKPKASQAATKASKGAKKTAKKKARKATKKKGKAEGGSQRSSPLGLEVDHEVLEFIEALDRFKKQNNRPFPSWSEVLQVLRDLGYRRD